MTFKEIENTGKISTGEAGESRGAAFEATGKRKKKSKVLIRVSDLKRSYQKIERGERKKEISVLKGLNFSVRAGEFVGIIGRSGCGKTTLLKILGLIDKQTEGTVYYKGIDTNELWDDELADIRRREIGFVFQDYYLMNSLSVEENILLPSILDKKSVAESLESSRHYAYRFGLKRLMKKRPYELSGGEKQRVAICRALINNPRLILADEPTGNLDSNAGDQVIETMRYINRVNKKTIVMVTHDPKMASYCSRLLLLKDGQMMQSIYAKDTGSQDEFYQRIIAEMKNL